MKQQHSNTKTSKAHESLTILDVVLTVALPAACTFYGIILLATHIA